MKQQMDKCILCGKEEDIAVLEYIPTGICQDCFGHKYPPDHIPDEQFDKYWGLLLKKRKP